MSLSNLKPTQRKKKSKPRVGRGGKRGTYSGRGLKGQKSRSGRKIRPAERDLVMRLPKKRGFQNKPKGPRPISFNLSELLPRVKPLAEGKKEIMVVEKSTLKQLGLIPAGYQGEVKILGDGDINFSIHLKGLKISKSAKIKIEKAGGRIEP